MIHLFLSSQHDKVMLFHDFITLSLLCSSTEDNILLCAIVVTCIFCLTLKIDVKQYLVLDLHFKYIFSLVSKVILTFNHKLKMITSYVVETIKKC